MDITDRKVLLIYAKGEPVKLSQQNNLIRGLKGGERCKEAGWQSAECLLPA
jgi:hypothetical protein